MDAGESEAAISTIQKTIKAHSELKWMQDLWICQWEEVQSLLERLPNMYKCYTYRTMPKQCTTGTFKHSEPDLSWFVYHQTAWLRRSGLIKPPPHRQKLVLGSLPSPLSDFLRLCVHHLHLTIPHIEGPRWVPPHYHRNINKLMPPNIPVSACQCSTMNANAKTTRPPLEQLRRHQVYHMKSRISTTVYVNDDKNRHVGGLNSI